MDHGYGAAPTRRASDSGLSGLGLIMQLVGGIMTAIVASYGMIFLIAMLMGGGRGGPPGTLLLFIFALLVTSIMRSVAHANAGRRLLYDGPGTPLSAMNRYLMFAWIQTAVVGGGLLLNNVPGGMMFGIVIMLAAWPLALMFVAKTKVAEFGDLVPTSDDKGFDGAAILMLIFGSIGLGIGSILLLGWLDFPMKGELVGMGMLVAYVMLVIRSVLHLRAGIRGISATHMSETTEAATKYAGFGVIASVVVGGVFLVMFLQATGGRGGGGGAMMIVMLMMVVMISWVLLVWPLTLRRFFTERHFETVMDERSKGLQQSTDRGLPTLGWLLLAFGVYAAATGLFTVLMGDMGDERAMRRMSRGDNPMAMMMGLMGNAGGKSPWFGIGVAALQIWAGVELIRLSPRYKLAGIVFGVIASGVALYIYLPMLSDLMKGGMAMLSNPMVGMQFAMVAMALVVPVATLIFVQRKIRDPKALAKTFE